MATPNTVLVPGSVVTTSGTYRVTHSTGHLGDADYVFLQGTILPSCWRDDCDVTFTLVAAHSSEDPHS